MLRFRSRVLRFRDLGASFSSFGCFMLRSSFSSASFSKLPNEQVHSSGNSSGVIVKHSYCLSGTAPRRRILSVGVACTSFSVFSSTSCLKQA